MIQFSRKKHRTGFSGAFQYGDTGKEILIFYIRLADGKLYPAVQIRKTSRAELAKVLLQFRRARQAVQRSSLHTFGGDFPAGSLRWLACYCGVVKDFTCKRGKIRVINFKNPCLRAALSFVG